MDLVDQLARRYGTTPAKILKDPYDEFLVNLDVMKAGIQADIKRMEISGQ